MFINRFDAAIQLAEKLSKFKNQDGVVLAIPRGGVPIGDVVSRELNFPLEIVLSKKIGHPRNPEFAIGSVTQYGFVVNENVWDVSMDYIQKEASRLQLILKEKAILFMGDRKPTNLKNKIVVIVDDGIATGSTILASVNMIKKSNPQQIIVAVPVAALESARKISKEVDEFVCLTVPDRFYGVGQFYEDFTQVSDEEVIQILQKKPILEKDFSE